MFDLHCHMLPNIDDGPESLDEAVQIARIAVANGITHTVLTPHIHPNRYNNDRVSIHQAYKRFKQTLEYEGISLALTIAAEVRIGLETLHMIQEDLVPWLGYLNGYKLLLLEFPHSHIPIGSNRIIKWLLARKVRPVIAHPERNKHVIRDINKIEPFVHMGCLLQVTAGSLTGNFGPFAKKRALELLKRGWVFLLATDAHNTTVREPDLEPGRAIAETIIGARESWKLVSDNPVYILAGRTYQTQKAII